MLLRRRVLLLLLVLEGRVLVWLGRVRSVERGLAHSVRAVRCGEERRVRLTHGCLVVEVETEGAPQAKGEFGRR